MGYFDFFRFLRTITYNLKSIIKYLCFCFLIIAFIIVCLLLMSCKVSAATLYSDYLRDYYVFEENNNYYFHNTSNVDVLLSNIDDSISNVFLVRELNPSVFLYAYFIFPENSIYTFYVLDNDDSLYFICNENYTVKIVNLGSGSVNTTNYNAGVSYKVTNHYNWYCPSPSIDNIYIDSSRSSIFIENPYANIFHVPSFVNYDDSNWSGTLANGEFTYFYIDTYTSNQVYMYFYDMTDLDENAETYEDLNIYSWSTTLDINSPYLYLTSDNNYQYAIPCVEPFGSYLDGHTYKLVLQYLDKNENWTDKVYEWTTQFSQVGITKQEENKENQYYNSINNINNTLNDKSFNESDITNKLPTPPTNEDITENGFNNIFEILRQTFTTNSNTAVVFHIPFTDGDITIPANLTENFVPEIIKNLIRLVYWYLISRFIVKDIASYIEKAKNGTITDGTDTNIKTDML